MDAQECELACLLYHTPTRELVARTDTLHLDTYSISAGKVLWNFTGERRGPGPPPVGRHRSNRAPCFCTEELVHLLEEVGYV